MSSVAVSLALPRVTNRAVARAALPARIGVWARRAGYALATALVVLFTLPVVVLSALLVFPLVPLFVWISALAVSAQAVGFDETADEEPAPLPVAAIEPA